MNTALNFRDWIQTKGGESDKKSGFSPLREKAWQRFSEIGFPTRKMENWRYLNLDTILKTSFSESDPAQPAVSGFAETCLQTGGQKNRLVFVNGLYSEKHSALNLNGRFQIGALSQAGKEITGRIHEVFGSSLDKEANAFELINAFRFRDGLYLFADKETVLAEPIHIWFISSVGADPMAFYPRIFVILEQGAKADVVMHHVDSSKGSYFMNSAARIFLGENSKLSWTQIHLEGDNGYQFMNSHVAQKKGSHFERVALFDGGRIARDEVRVDLQGEQAYCSLSGLAVLSKKSQVFQHAYVHHQAPKAVSRQVYKNILAEEAVAEFDSLVHVWRGANGSDSEQVDRNLLLSEKARVYARPQLKIDNDDVKANHGAATGQLQQEELFYLQSRGIKKDAAQLMLTYGFAEEVIQRIPLEHFRQSMAAYMRGRIQKMIAPVKKEV